MATPDPLLCLRAALSAFPDAPLTLVKLRTSEGDIVEEVARAATLVLEQIHAAAQPTHDAGAPALTFATDTHTRMLRTRDSAAQSPAPTPESHPDQFLTLGALIFAVQQRAERAGAYMRNAATAKTVAIPALERPGVLEYLLGKRDAWEGIVAPDGTPTVSAADAGAEATDAAAPASGTPGKRPYVPDAADVEFVRNLRAKYEIVLLDRNAVLAGAHALAGSDAYADTASSPAAHAHADAYGLRALFKPRLEQAKRQLHAPAKSSAPARASSATPSHAARRSRAQDPILLLSNSPTALVNMFNVKSLLQDGVFVPPEEARRQAHGVAEPVVTIQTRSDDEAAGTPRTAQLSRRILVVDNAEAVNRLGNGPAGSGQDPWNRVIAVFTTGQTWQFKSYRWSDPRDLFKNAMGVYVRWNNEAPNPQVRDWSVTDLQVDRTKRHTDKQLVAFFWRALDGWVQRKKPHLQLS